MGNALNLLLSVLLVLWGYMTFWFTLSVIRKRNDIADIAWGLGFVLVTGIAYLLNSAPSLASTLMLLLVSLWGARLSMHIANRNRSKSEDYRYEKWRKEWKSLFYIRSYFQVFILQGLLLLIIAIPAVLTAGLENKIDITSWALAGVLLWATGFYFETVADLQLRKFSLKKTSPNEVLTSGLWRYSRHPNYFGEVLQWWGIWLIMLSTTLPIEIKILCLLSPLTITVLILFISGIPMLEKKFMKNPAYRKYAASTSRFLPREPKIR